MKVIVVLIDFIFLGLDPVLAKSGFAVFTIYSSVIAMHILILM